MRKGIKRILAGCILTVIGIVCYFIYIHILFYAMEKTVAAHVKFYINMINGI
jgi:Na+-transporting methylmalonyl-CoA/oxaloacetate decarboxylase gamma subunit